MAVATPTKPAAPTHAVPKEWQHVLDYYVKYPIVRQKLQYAAAAEGLEQFQLLIKNALADLPLSEQVGLDVEGLYAKLHGELEAAYVDRAKDNQKHEQEHTTPHPKHHSFIDKLQEGLVPGVAAAVQKPKFMEEDPKFWAIQQKIYKEEWEDKNPKLGRSATSEEKAVYEEKKVNFLYGDLDDSESKSLEQRAKEKLREEYLSETNDKKKKKNEEKLTRYDENSKKSREKHGLG